uniref:Uncharacterized protein n=1 Tax=Solanum lycopersicum TaxID=4081 RepID=A0A3Q7F188_SOLLC
MKAKGKILRPAPHGRSSKSRPLTSFSDSQNLSGLLSKGSSRRRSQELERNLWVYSKGFFHDAPQLRIRKRISQIFRNIGVGKKIQGSTESSSANIHCFTIFPALVRAPRSGIGGGLGAQRFEASGCSGGRGVCLEVRDRGWPRGKGRGVGACSSRSGIRVGLGAQRFEAGGCSGGGGGSSLSLRTRGPTFED